jgi:ABC-type spermidine/putrescine transport system permease subunit I
MLTSRWFVVLLLAPLLILLFTMFAYPMWQVLSTSVGDGAYPFEDYVVVLRDPIMWVSLGRTLLISTLVALFSLLLGYPIATLIATVRGGWQIALLALVVIPMWSSVIARTFAWFGMFRPHGVVNTVLTTFGLPPAELLFTPTAVIIGMTNVMLPILILPVFAALNRYDRSLSLASATLGAGPLRTLFQVKLPVLAPQIITGCAAVFILSMGFFISPALLGGPKSSMISNLIYQQVRDRFDFARADAIAVVLIIVTFLIAAALLLVSRFLRRRT